jgi:hypothetical protein
MRHMQRYDREKVGLPRLARTGPYEMGWPGSAPAAEKFLIRRVASAAPGRSGTSAVASTAPTELAATCTAITGLTRWE